MTKIILVRHGMSESNRDRIFTGHTNVALTEKGIMQAKLTAKYIFNNYKVDKIYASDLQRAYNTAEETAKLFNLSVIPDKNLREIYAGEWEGKSFEFLMKEYEKDYSLFKNDVGNAVCTGGESTKHMAERIVKEIRRIVEENPGKTVMIATHATPIRAAICVFGNHTLDEMKDIPWVSNASVTVLNIDREKTEFEVVGEDVHLADLSTKLPSSV
ncbi:MAG: histidine phosphatase family protein [Clostridiales bacterium]|nr:histidine phosphatase family protein [Clostridiales bacterium]